LRNKGRDSTLFHLNLSRSLCRRMIRKSASRMSRALVCCWIGGQGLAYERVWRGRSPGSVNSQTFPSSNRN
jgi:hypothetical protein